MSTDPKTLAADNPATDNSSERLRAIFDACSSPAHTTSLNIPGGLDGGAKQVGLSFSVDTPGAVCGRRQTLVVPPDDGALVYQFDRQSDWHESLRGTQSHWTETLAPHARILTGHDAQGNMWAIQFHKGGGRVESFIDDLGGLRSVAQPNQGAAASDSGICLDCLKAAAAAGSATVVRG